MTLDVATAAKPDCLGLASIRSLPKIASSTSPTAIAPESSPCAIVSCACARTPKPAKAFWIKFSSTTFAGANNHDGGRVKFGPDGKLYWTMGDAQTIVMRPNNLTSLNGKILRLNPDGSIPADNPLAELLCLLLRPSQSAGTRLATRQRPTLCDRTWAERFSGLLPRRSESDRSRARITAGRKSAATKPKTE